jgi:tetratricopeptide (TPR) repeat protein
VRQRFCEASLTEVPERRKVIAMSEPVPSKEPRRTPLRRRLIQLAVVLILGVGIASVVFALARGSRVIEPPVIDCSNAERAVERAITAARENVRAAPRSAKAWGHLGMVLLAHAFVPESVICLRQAEQLDGKDPRWPYFQALAVRRTDPETGIVHLRRAVALCGNEPDAPRLLLGELLLQSGRLDEAEQQFQSVLQNDPANGRAHLGMGRIEYEQESFSASIPHYRKAAADMRTRKMGLIHLAETYQRLGDAETATATQKQASNVPQDLPWPDSLAQQYSSLQTGEAAAINEAYALLADDRAPEALDLLLRTLRVYPDSAVGWQLLGRGMIRQGEHEGAETALRRAIRLQSDAPEAQFYLGVALFLQKMPKEALPYFRKATELKPAYPFAHYNLGECLRQLNDLPGAIEAFRAAIRCQPAFADAHLTLGELLSQQGQTTEACQQLRETLRLRPEDTRARQLLDQLHCPDVATPVDPGAPQERR